MLDFCELSEDGRELEQLVRELFFSLGYKIFWSGLGPDGGKDLLCFEECDSDFVGFTRKWLIQCKHKAIGGKSVGIDDLDDIVDSCAQHDCDGYLLVTSTHPSSTVTNRLESITKNPKISVVATCWDAVEIERRLRAPEQWHIAQRFFPNSAKGWEIYSSERPNHWTANYKGYYFHICNRIGSKCQFYLQDIEEKIDLLESFAAGLDKKHFFRLRSVYFDDKHGVFVWYVDYMYPHDQSPKLDKNSLEKVIANDWNQNLDLTFRTYLEFSDHYDPDHYDYYNENMGQFILGAPRTTV